MNMKTDLDAAHFAMIFYDLTKKCSVNSADYDVISA